MHLELSKAFVSVVVVLSSCLAPIAGAHSDASVDDRSAAPVLQDPYLWLEEMEGDRAAGWVRRQNEKTRRKMVDTPQFEELERGIRTALDSDANIPSIGKMGDYYYNFKRDEQNPRGLWRRTTLDEYRRPHPHWEVLLDIDALNAEKGGNWLMGGTGCLRPDYVRCLISFSRGGSDARMTREFDLASREWIDDGFFLPEAKGGMGWIDQDTVYVTTDFGEGSLTSSGYPRIVKRWRRGTPLESAETVYEGQVGDVMVRASRSHTPGYERDFIDRMISGQESELYLLDAGGGLVKIDVPDSAGKTVTRQWLQVHLTDTWGVGGKSYPAGSLIVIDFDDFMAGDREFEVVFAPTETTSLAGVGWTKSHLILNVLEDVRNRLYVLTPTGEGWVRNEFMGASGFGTVSARALDSNESDMLWVSESGYLTPTTLSLADVEDTLEPIKAMPAFFDASRHVVEQHFAGSKDGTRIPYFLVRPKDISYDGSTPTLLYGYGGFGAALRPSYSPAVGMGWLERGGAYVVANIRGGGEYGPRWHQAALKENRHKAYEDFVAVARDLIDRAITSPRRLGVQGGSNGGLLTGNMLVRHPELFGAVVIQVPLLDMQRYHKLLAGASWMAEYGNPDIPEEWEFIRSFSPYHLFDPDRNYPPVLFTTSTRDDRVHPGHARKMAAKMIDAGKDVTYYENVEGGHSGSADNAQAAFMAALMYTFLWERLAD